jgi:hypothetical protein
MACAQFPAKGGGASRGTTDRALLCSDGFFRPRAKPREGLISEINELTFWLKPDFSKGYSILAKIEIGRFYKNEAIIQGDL